MKQVISVVVPVYNVAAYLEACLQSLLEQDYDALEVLLIDDGSTDDSGKICDAYALRDSRFRVIHQKNGGAAAAKNAGLRVATGEYLMFLDSDDYLEPGACRHVVELLEQHGADVVQCGIRYVYRNSIREFIPEQSGRVFPGKEYLRRFAVDWTCGLMTDKLFRRSIFDGIFFGEGRKIDDEFFTYRGIMNAASVVCDSRVIYNYRQRASGVMLSPESCEQICRDRIAFMEQRRKNVAARFPDLQRDFDIAFVDALGYMADYPNNTPENIRNLRRHSLAYFLKPGNTFPPRHLLRGLLRLHFTPAKTLIRRGNANARPMDPEEFFP